MPFLDDNRGNATTEIKKQQRLKYLDSCLKEFSTIFLDKNLYDKQIPILLNNVYWSRVFPHIRSKMIDPNNRIDLHKIISGTQATIMMCCLLRTEETYDIPPSQTNVAKENKELLEINAQFALFVGLNILEQWHDIDISPLKSRPIFLREHQTWLQNALTLDENNYTVFPFFSISQVWYLAEELCRVSPVQ